MKNSVNKILKIGVVGFSRNQFDKATACQILDECFQTLTENYPDTTIKIVSGYTDSGVPRIAYQVAEKYDFIKVGFSARQALKVRSGLYPVDEVMLQGNRFGDESAGFVKYIDQLIRVGGGQQSRKEVEMFKQLQQNVDNLADILQEFEVEWYGN